MIKKILFVISIIFIILIPISIPRLIKIEKIECATQYGTCSEDMQFTITNLPARPAGGQFTNLQKAKKEIGEVMKSYYYVSDFSAQFKIPNSLKVQILVKKPTYAIKQKGTENFALVDFTGTVLGISNSSSLPRIEIDQQIKSVGEKISDSELLALNLVGGVFSMYQVGLGRVEGPSLLVELPQGNNVIFPLDGDRDILLGSLRLIYSKVQDREIDLRFANPVLR
ncbi:MAG: hypothetical protein AAB535_04055 [Patescibacteria group bacterium]